jgi:hypothetical protein
LKPSLDNKSYYIHSVYKLTRKSTVMAAFGRSRSFGVARA